VIVLDENIDQQRVLVPLKSRYKGKIISVRDLRPGTVIKDEAIPAILCQHRQSTFVTTNVIDFWRRVTPHSRYCIVCVPLPAERQDEIPNLLLKLLRQQAFRTARQRMGKVIRASQSEILYYEVTRTSLAKVAWA